MRVGCAHLLPQLLGIGVCRGHFRCQEKVLWLHRGCSHGCAGCLLHKSSWQRWWGGLRYSLCSIYQAVHPGALSTQVKEPFFNLAQMHQWVGATCSPVSLAVITVLFQLGEESCLRVSLSLRVFLSKELPQFSSASKYLFRGSSQALWWMTNASLAIHRWRIILCQETFWVL